MTTNPSSEQTEIIEAFRQLTPQQQKAALLAIRKICRKSAQPIPKKSPKR